MNSWKLMRGPKLIPEGQLSAQCARAVRHGRHCVGTVLTQEALDRKQRSPDWVGCEGGAGKEGAPPGSHWGGRSTPSPRAFLPLTPP